jgi:hypothetical protein
MLDRKGAKAAQLDTVTAGQGSRDLIEDRGDDPLHIAVIEMRIELADPKDEFGLWSSKYALKTSATAPGGVSVPKRFPRRQE